MLRVLIHRPLYLQQWATAGTLADAGAVTKLRAAAALMQADSLAEAQVAIGQVQRQGQEQDKEADKVPLSRLATCLPKTR